MLATLTLLALPRVALAQSDATLAYLWPSEGTLTPDFNSAIFSYTASVPNTTTAITVTPLATDFYATVTVNGVLVNYGFPSDPINLGVGATNVIAIVVVSQDLSATNTYVVTVTRAALPSSNASLASLTTTPATTLTPPFDSGTTSYTASVPYPTPSMTVTPTAADTLATIKVNGNTVASGSASAPISLSVGANIITTEVTAEDAVTTMTYTLTVTVTVPDPVAMPGGPYFVFGGGTLALNGSASVPSDGHTITSYEWDLNPADNGGAFNANVTGATPMAVSEADLRSTYGMSLGGNTIKLRVTDSSAKTSIAQATVNILPAIPLVYEPFAYSGTVLNGVSGTTEVGLTGTWNATTATLGPNLAYGPLVTRGAGIGNLAGGVNHYGGARPVDPTALKDKGLLNDGATLWFSVIVGYDTGGNLTNTRLGFGLANSQFDPANFRYNILNEGAQLGSGLGLTLGRFTVGGTARNGYVVATQFRDPSTGTGFAGNLFGTTTALPIYTVGGQSGLIVGKISWGATASDVDTIELYNPGLDLVLPASPISVLSVVVDQSTYDTITWARGDKVIMDEIRFGGSYQAVIETGSAWDLNGNIAGAGGPTPSGTWNTDPIWNLAPDGTLVPIPWQAGSVAVFSAGNDATGAYTVTVSGTRDVGGLVFEDGTATISGGTALRLIKDTTASVAPGRTASIATPLTEDGSGRQFAKAGAGTLILSGNNVAATNGMNLSAGVTRFESPSSINGTAPNDTLGSGGAMMFGPAFGATNIPTALLNRVAESSAGAIAADNYASSDFDFNTPNLTNAYLGAAGIVNYTGILTPGGTTYRLGGGGGALTMVNPNAITGANNLFVNGNVTLAQDNDYTGVTTIYPSSTVTILGATSSSGVSLNTPNSVLIVGNNGSLGFGTLTVVNSFAGPGTLAAIGTVVTANPVAANTDFVFGGTGSLTLGNVTLNNNVTVQNTNTTSTSIMGAITANGGVRTLALSGNGNTIVTGAIGGGSGISTLAKSGTGTLTLLAANSYTGVTTVSGGVLRLDDANAIPGGIGAAGGTAGLTFNGGVIGLGADDFQRPWPPPIPPGRSPSPATGGGRPTERIAL